MKDLIEAFTIFSKYCEDKCVTHCEHDELHVVIDYSEVSEEDIKRLEELHFNEYDGHFISYYYGSC